MLLKDLYKKIDKSTRIRVGLFLGFLYSLYNLTVGCFIGTTWHITIGVYYFLLIAVKIILLKVGKEEKMSTKLFIITTVMLFLISFSLIGPIITMINNQRPVSIPLTISIGIAAYTTYKVTFAVIGFVKRGLSSNLLISEMATIGLVEAIVSVLTLQNTLITVNGGADDVGLTILSAISSTLGLIGILYLILRIIIKFIKDNKNKKNGEPSS